MPLLSGKFDVGDTAVQVTVPDLPILGSLPTTVIVRHSSAGGDVFLGETPAVTPTTGFALGPNETITVLLFPGEGLWAISSTGTHIVDTLTQGAAGSSGGGL